MTAHTSTTSPDLSPDLSPDPSPDPRRRAPRSGSPLSHPDAAARSRRATRRRTLLGLVAGATVLTTVGATLTASADDTPDAAPAVPLTVRALTDAPPRLTVAPTRAPQRASRSVRARTAPPARTVATGRGFSGEASWYGPGFQGRRTASGERYDMYALTAAHRTLPFGTRLRVCRSGGERCVVVRVNDRGPFVGGRVLDLSKAAAQQLGFSGTAWVTATPVRTAR